MDDPTREPVTADVTADAPAPVPAPTALAPISQQSTAVTTRTRAQAALVVVRQRAAVTWAWTQVHAALAWAWTMQHVLRPAYQYGREWYARRQAASGYSYPPTAATTTAATTLTSVATPGVPQSGVTTRTEVKVKTYRGRKPDRAYSRDATRMARYGWVATSTTYGGSQRVGCLAFLLFGLFSLLGGRKAGQLTVTYQRQVPA